MSFDLADPKRTINVAVVLMSGVTELLDVAPVDLIAGISTSFVEFMPLPASLKGQALSTSIFWVNEHGDDAKLTAGARTRCQYSFASCPKVDIVLIGAAEMGYVPNQAEIRFLQKSFEQSSAFLLICGGFVPALHAGLLHGKRATAPRGALVKLQKDHPETQWLEQRWVRDGKLWTSGTLLNGLDLMKSFVLETWGDRELVKYMVEIGSWPARDVEYDK